MNRTYVDNITSPVGGVRRRGNVLLFVIFILGTLFAASMAFLALMRTEAGVMASRRDQAKLDVIFGGLSDDLMLDSARALMGQGIILAGLDGVPCNGDDTYLSPVPYAQSLVDCTGLDTNGDGFPDAPDGLADNPDMLAPYAMIAGVHPLLSSLEPYDPGTGVLEWFAVSDPYRAWDNRADVHSAVLPAAPIQPSLPATRPLRIRPLNGIGLLPPYNYIYDATDDTITRQWGLSDADGDGVVDSVRYRVALLGGGEADWGPGGFVLGDTDDTACDGVIDAPFTGAPSFTTMNPLMLTPVPCDAFNPNDPTDLTLEDGTAYSQIFRRAIAAKLRDPDENIADPLDDLYFSLRLIQNGGMANLEYSHRTLIDNLFGLDSFGAPVAGKMMNLPYGPAVEKALRRRGVLAPLRWNDPLATLGPLGEDMLADDGRDGSLYKTLFEALIVPQTGPPEDLQWFPVLDEPGGVAPGDVYDLDWAGRWMNPDRWNDLNDSAGVGNVSRHYVIPNLVTTVSTDDVLMRNGKFGTGLLTGGLPAYVPAQDSHNPTGTPVPLPYANADGESALSMYGYDPQFVLDPGTGWITGDRSFIDTAPGGTLLPKVPFALRVDAANFNEYGPPRDANGGVIDPRFGRMQFALHSIGDINKPTRREINTVQDYFTVMLRNVTVLGPPGPDGIPGTADDQDLIHDQAAQLTANFFDFADFDAGRPGGGAAPINPAGQPSDVPTRIISRSTAGTRFYGIEKQPYISEIYWDPGNSQLAIELTNPHNVPIDLAPTSASGAFTPYSLRLLKGGDETILFSLPLESFRVSQKNVIPAGGYVYVASTYDGLPPGNQSLDELINTPSDLCAEADKIQLFRKLSGGVSVLCDEVQLPSGFCDFINTRQRDNDPAHYGGWRVTVPQYVDGLAKTLGKRNDAVLLKAVVPVHAATDDMGLESAYPTTGSMLLLMRNANKTNAAANAALGGAAAAAILDNGHMPVFDTAQVAQGAAAGAQPMDGTTLLSIPWGQLVFDYFTALPFDNQFDPLASPPAFTIPTFAGDAGDPDWPSNPNGDADGDGLPARMDRGYAEYVAYLRANQPTVELGGVRVHGRININAAPWKVLDGLPLMPPQVMPIYKWLYPYAGPIPVPPIDQWKWRNVLLDPNGGFPMGFDSFTPTGTDGSGLQPPFVEQLGAGKAKGIVAYRELRDITDPSIPWTTGNYNTLSGGSRWRSDGSGAVNFLANTTQRHTAGFLTVGELANVRLLRTTLVPVTDGFSQMDNGQTHVFIGPGAPNYLFAVAPLVALGDWVTVKGHTFTAYGVLTGHGDVLPDPSDPDDVTVLDLAERFEMVFDRSNLLISDDPAERPEVIYKVREPLSEVNPN